MTIKKIRTKKRKHPLYGLTTGGENTVVTASSLITAELIIVPEKEKNRIESHVPEELKEKVHYIENDCSDIWEWSEKVYEYAKNIDS